MSEAQANLGPLALSAVASTRTLDGPSLNPPARGWFLRVGGRHASSRGVGIWRRNRVHTTTAEFPNVRGLFCAMGR